MSLKEEVLKKVKALKKEKIKTTIFERALSEIGEDFTVRVTKEKIIIKDEVTYLKFTPKEMGEILIEKLGKELIVSVEKDKKQ